MSGKNEGVAMGRAGDFEWNQRRASDVYVRVQFCLVHLSTYRVRVVRAYRVVRRAFGTYLGRFWTVRNARALS